MAHRAYDHDIMDAFFVQSLLKSRRPLHLSKVGSRGES
jgi:hypothetical protein